MGKEILKKNINIFINKLSNFLSNIRDNFDISSNITKRIISGLILVLLAVFAIYFSKSLFFILTIAITIIMTTEWLEMINYQKNKIKWQYVGLFYILIPIWSILELREYDPDILLWMFAIIWSTDSFAYFTGKSLGGKKLMPKVSPNKTWSGLVGGIIASVFVGFLSSFMFPGSLIFFIFTSIILSIIAQIGDLLESKFKRIFGVKDSGNIIPGHGGVLDRLDAMMLVAPVTLLIVLGYLSNFIE